LSGGKDIKRETFKREQKKRERFYQRFVTRHTLKKSERNTSRYFHENMQKIKLRNKKRKGSIQECTKEKKEVYKGKREG